MSFFHGIEIVEVDDGIRPIQTVRSSVIGIVGTAPDAKDTDFPLNTPVLVAGSLVEAAKLGKTGTLPDALRGILAQVGAFVVVVRVAHDDDDAELLKNIQGGVDPVTGERLGIHALLDAKSKLGLTPRLLIAPGFTNEVGIAKELQSIADKLKAIAIVEAPSTTDEAAIAYAKEFGSPRIYIIEPRVSVLKDGVRTNVPASPVVAGLIAKVDKEKGWHYSPSNNEINAIVGTERPIDFELNSDNRANYLNENKIATIINQDGYRLWGNLTASADAKWQFLSVRRTADMLNESLLYSHAWAVDRAITKTFVDDIVMGVNDYLRSLVSQSRILGGKCWIDPELNSNNDIALGKITFSFDFTPCYPAQHIVFRSHLVNDYIEEIF